MAAYAYVFLPALGENVIVRAADGASIPMKTSNSDYVAFLKWKMAGGVADNTPSN